MAFKRLRHILYVCLQTEIEDVHRVLRLDSGLHTEGFRGSCRIFTYYCDSFVDDTKKLLHRLRMPLPPGPPSPVNRPRQNLIKAAIFSDPNPAHLRELDAPRFPNDRGGHITFGKGWNEAADLHVQ